MNPKILIIGACGQIGSELTTKLRDIHDKNQVVASDINKNNLDIVNSGLFEILDAQDYSSLKNCIEKLSEDQRNCIEYFYYKSFSYKKIATLLKLKWNTVRSNIQNGRRMLKNCIEKNA